MMEKWYEKTMTKKSHMIILSLWLQDKDKSLVSTSISKKKMGRVPSLKLTYPLKISLPKGKLVFPTIHF